MLAASAAQRAGALLQPRGRAGRCQALRGLPEGELAAAAPSRGASCAPKATGCWRPAPISGRHRAPSRRRWSPMPAMPRPGSASPARCSPSARTRAASATTCPSTPRARPGTPTSAAQTPAAKAAALLVLHEAFKRRSYWRPAIDALRASVALADNPEAQAALETLVARARLPHHRIQGRQPTPRSRACASSSARRWRPARSTGRSTSRSTARTRRRSTAEARQICVDGLAHGRRYEVQVRAGLPSAIRGETLAQDGGACRLREGPGAVGAGRGAQLRAAQPRPAGHPARHRQHRQAPDRGLPHRRPQHRPGRCRAATSRGSSRPTT